MPRLRIVLIVFIILALTSLFWGWSTRAEQMAAAGSLALTPEMVARQQVVCSGGTTLVPQSFRITTTRWMGRRAVVFFTARWGVAEWLDSRAAGMTAWAFLGGKCGVPGPYVEALANDWLPACAGMTCSCLRGKM